MGYGFDIVSALKKSNGEILCWTHADLQTDPIDALKAFDYYKNYKKVNNKFIVKGSRKNRKLVERFFTFGMEIITFFILNIYLKDINAQPKLFSRTFFKNFLTENHPNDFSLDTHLLILAKRNGYEIKSFKVDFKNRIHGQAKGGGGGWIERINLIIRTLKYIIRLRKKLY